MVLLLTQCRFKQALRHFQMVFQCGNFRIGPFFQCKVLTPIRLALKQADRLLVGGDHHVHIKHVELVGADGGKAIVLLLHGFADCCRNGYLAAGSKVLQFIIDLLMV